jgi:hypothetical protein
MMEGRFAFIAACPVLFQRCDLLEMALFVVVDSAGLEPARGD